MTYLAYHHHKKSGTIYVYSVKSYWDKERKVARNKQVCIGKLDQQTGEIIPSKRQKKVAERAEAAPGVTATIRIAGPSLILDHFARETGLADLLKRCFPASYPMIMSLIYFIVQKGLPLSRCEFWSAGYIHPLGAPLSSQRVSELLFSITEEERQRFLSLWLEKITEHDYLCYDITSVSSYSTRNEFVEYGYNRDGESLPQINLAMLFGQKSRLPAYYRRVQGNISDVATLATSLKAMDFIGAHKMHLVMDRGFFSIANIDELLRRRYHFTIAVPAGRKWVEEIIDQHYESIASPQNYVQLNGKESIFAATTLHKWGKKNRRTYLHVYHNAYIAAEAFDDFTNRLVHCKKELEAGGKTTESAEFCARFFDIRETPKRGKRVSFNDAEIQKHRKRYSGFFCILSTGIRDASEALRIYRAKDVVENCFDDLKNQMNMKRLRVHSSAAMDGRIFLQFLALILISRLREGIQADEDLKHLTVREVMEAMEPFAKITYSGHYGKLYTEASPLQRKIMVAFGGMPEA